VSVRFEDIKNLIEQTLTAKVDDLGQELSKVHGRLMRDFRKDVEVLTNRVEEIESRATSPGRTSLSSTTVREHKQLFEVPSCDLGGH
jgi:hypothetical protein